MASITQDMRYRLSLIKYAEKYGVTKAAIKYKINRQYIYRWKRRYDGSIESLRNRSITGLYRFLRKLVLCQEKVQIKCNQFSLF